MNKKLVVAGAVFIIVAMCGFDNDSQRPFPEELNYLKNARPETYLKKVNEIPPAVLEALGRAMPSKKVEMADSGGKWNETCVVLDSSLPFRRLFGP